MRIQLEKTLTDKITDIASLKRKIAMWHFQDKKVVFTNGVFDLLHTGHITYLAKAAELGDKLIIGLNADASVKRLKGPDRPVNDENSRALLLASLFFVDAIVMFDEDTPLNLINAIQPNIIAKGSDYSADQVVGGKEVLAWGGEIALIDLVEGRSTSNIIKKMNS